MQLKTILNRVQKHKSFVYGTGHLRRIKGRLSLEVPIRPRKNGTSGATHLNSEMANRRVKWKRGEADRSCGHGTATTPRRSAVASASTIRLRRVPRKRVTTRDRLCRTEPGLFRFPTTVGGPNAGRRGESRRDGLPSAETTG